MRSRLGGNWELRVMRSTHLLLHTPLLVGTNKIEDRKEAAPLVGTNTGNKRKGRGSTTHVMSASHSRLARSVAMLPSTHSALLARVIATFIRRMSVTKPAVIKTQAREAVWSDGGRTHDGHVRAPRASRNACS